MLCQPGQPFLHRRATALFALGLLLAARCSVAAPAGDIVVVTVHGNVTATMAGVSAPLSPNAVLQLPATIRTGHDGSIELRQGPTTVAAAADTELEIPRSAAEEGLIERIVQISGNAFYNVGKRERTKLRVETPYLVAVIKGTQFNVASMPDSTTIALFEGRLEVRAADESDVVDLKAGQIAIRHRNDVSIDVLSMKTAAASRNRGDRAASTGAVAAPNNDTGATTTIGTDVSSGANAGIDATPAIGVGSGAATANAAVDLNAGSAGAGSASVGVAASVAAGGAAVDVGVGANLPDSAVGVGTNVGASVGGIGVETSTSTGIDVGTGSVAADVDASLGGGNGRVSVDLGTSASAQGTAATVAAGVGADLGNTGHAAIVEHNVGSISTTVDVGVTTPVVDVDADTNGPSATGLLHGRPKK
jgi:hypothetical protein